MLGVAREGGLPDVGVGDQDPSGQGGGGQVAQCQQQVNQSLLHKQNIESGQLGLIKGYNTHHFRVVHWYEGVKVGYVEEDDEG